MTMSQQIVWSFISLFFTLIINLAYFFRESFYLYLWTNPHFTIAKQYAGSVNGLVKCACFLNAYKAWCRVAGRLKATAMRKPCWFWKLQILGKIQSVGFETLHGRNTIKGLRLHHVMKISTWVGVVLRRTVDFNLMFRSVCSDRLLEKAGLCTKYIFSKFKQVP